MENDRKKIPLRPITEIVTRHCCPSCGRVLVWTYEEDISKCECGQMIRWREE